MVRVMVMVMVMVMVRVRVTVTGDAGIRKRCSHTGIRVYVSDAHIQSTTYMLNAALGHNKVYPDPIGHRVIVQP